MKNIRILLYAVSMLMLSGCSGGIGTDADAGMTKIFNVTCSTDVTNDRYSYNPPNWNVIFPPVLDETVCVFKGIVRDGQIDGKEKTTEYKTFSKFYDSDYKYLGHKNMDYFYAAASDTVYLSPDDDDNYALLVWSYKVNSDGKIPPNGYIQSDFFYPKDLIAIKCKSFTWSSSGYYSEYYSWTIEFSERPDSLYFVRSTNYSLLGSKAYWKLSDSYKDKEIELDDTNLIPTSTGSYITTGSYSVNSSSGDAALFAKYGDYYVRVTPRA